MDGWDGEQGGEASSMVIYSFFHSLMEDLNCIRRSAWVRLPIIPSCGSHLGAVSNLVLRLLPKLFSCKHFGCMQLCCISMENCNAAGLWDCTADCCSSNEVASFSLSSSHGVAGYHWVYAHRGCGCYWVHGLLPRGQEDYGQKVCYVPGVTPPSSA